VLSWKKLITNSVGGDEIMLVAALRYAVRGKPVFPLDPDTKHPMCRHGFHDATTDERMIRAWWEYREDSMIGMPTGAASGVWVLDVDLDVRRSIDGRIALARLELAHSPLPRTLTARTPRGGMHYYFEWTGVDIHCRESKIGPGLDVRGNGGYVAVPPSVRSDGAAYHWLDIQQRPVGAPDWLVALATKPNSTPRTVIDLNQVRVRQQHQQRVSARDYAWAHAALEHECTGLTSNSALNIAAFNLGQLVAAGSLSEDEVRSALIAAAEARGMIVDYGEPSVLATIKSGLAAGMKNPRYRPN
jgi:hypothetical protein